MSASRKILSSAHEASLMGRIPLLDDGRVYRGWAVWIFAAFAYGAATWGFLTGGFLGSFLPAPEAMASLFLGQTLALLFCVSFLGVVSTTYGIDTVDAAKPAFGLRGSQLVTFLVVTIMIGWILVLVAFTGVALSRFAGETLGTPPSDITLGVLMLVMVAVCAALAMTGPKIFARLYGAVAPIMILLVIVLFTVLVREYGLANLFAMQPPEEWALPGREGFTLGVELGIGFGFAYWISVGALFRLVKSRGLAIHGSMIGWALMTVPVISVAILSALAVGSEDPTVWMYDLAGDWGGAIAVTFIVVANISSTVLMFYIALIAIQQSKAVARISPKWTITVLALPAVWVAFRPDQLFEWYATFLYYNGVLIAPVVAILTVDYFVLRRKQIDLRHVFCNVRGSRYWFWGGVNWVAIAVVAIGFGFYNLLYNPVTAEYTQAFTYMTASVPTVLLCAVLYYLVMKLAVLPRSVGGYRDNDQDAYAEVSDDELTL